MIVRPIAPLSLAVFLAIAGCSVGKAEQSPQPAAERPAEEPGLVAVSAAAQAKLGVGLQEVATRSILDTLPATGKLALIPDRQAHVTVTVTGRVSAIFKRIGDPVAKGAPLAVIDSPDLGQAESDFLQAEAGLRLAREAYERQEGLFSKQYAPQKDLVQAKTEHAKASIEHERARNKLLLLGMSPEGITRLARKRAMDSTLTIRAPLAGRVTSRTLTLGETIQAGSAIFTVADAAHLWAMADVHEKDLSRVRPGAAVTVTSIAYPGRAWPGRVESVSEALDPDTHTVKARVALENPGLALKPEMFVKAAIAAPAVQPYPSVPAEAVVLDGLRRVVYVARGPERFEQREVEVGAEGGGWVALTKGVKVGERVVARGALLITEQAKGE